ncbi:hypothetical protein A3Q56_00303 [Intoshia linei]|uniref:DNA mismatch repair proteins mutS family domain-containing protein n=1 Tax=Intoshia linei TaxID=1819745 RepID=A0A177BEC0_9BILA|nr:hypothetical protein A3Q56_00303 [Intoshia linei]
MQLKEKYNILGALAAVINFTETTYNLQFYENSLHICFYKNADYCSIDSVTVSNLELIKSNYNLQKYTLIDVLNGCETKSGMYLLRENILSPLTNRDTIISRQNSVEELVTKKDKLRQVCNVLKKIVDFKIILPLFSIKSELYTNKSIENKISGLIALKQNLEICTTLQQITQEFQSPIIIEIRNAVSSQDIIDILETLNTYMQSEVQFSNAPLKFRTNKCHCIKNNINGYLDITRKMYIELVNDAPDIINSLREYHKLPLLLAYNTTRGYHIKLTVDNANVELPSDFIKVQRKRNFILFTVDELIILNLRISQCVQEIFFLSNSIVTELIEKVAPKLYSLYYITDNIYLLDILCCFAKYSFNNGTVRPQFGETLIIKNAKHAIMNAMPDLQISNNISLNQDKTGMIITGSNMSGKSTYLKMIAIIQIIAQMGCHVPATFASIKIRKSILSRMGNDNDILANCSTVTNEMKELNYVCKNCDQDSLIILDELGRGTSLQEGVACAIAIILYLLKKKSFLIVATHFNEICLLSMVNKHLQNYHFQMKSTVIDGKFQLNFDRKLHYGSMINVENYGIFISNITSFPKSIIKRAEEIAHQLSISTTIGDDKIKNFMKLEQTMISLISNFYDAECDDDEKKYEMHHNAARILKEIQNKYSN